MSKKRATIKIANVLYQENDYLTKLALCDIYNMVKEAFLDPKVQEAYKKWLESTAGEAYR